MSFLQQVTKGKIVSPHLILIYGTDGVGKSTFASEAPAPIFIGPEDGTKNLDVARMPQPKIYTDISTQIAELYKESHKFQTLVIDSIDWIEPLIWEHVCKVEGVKSLEKVGGGYGKGYVEAQLVWRDLVSDLQALQSRTAMNVILVGHSFVKPFHDPEANESYDRYQIKMNDKASAVLREFVDVVLFTNFEVATKKDDGSKKAKAYGDGTRVMYTERRPAFDAKNRIGLPFKMSLSWKEYEKHASRPADPKGLETQIKKGALNLDKEMQKKVADAVVRAGSDPNKLNKILNRIETLQEN